MYQSFISYPEKFTEVENGVTKMLPLCTLLKRNQNEMNITWIVVFLC
jgi:hypothetical protein